ncbi:putative Ig domain-containing protein [Marilutibacter chinensis]|uniref:putative Ig domain-containing protein n=1 Tax=Marilutibacter chinensis TaxID=2912247 RepID=UPI003CCD1ADC
MWSRIATAGLLCLAGLWSASASAQTSTYCPTPLTATVANGGSVSVDVSSCDGPFDGGMSGPIAPFAQHGTVTIGPNSGGTQFVDYAHNGNSATSDTFWLEDNDLGTVRVDITISPPTSAIVVSPSTLPTLTAGTSFSQLLTSAGGTAPYAYSLQSGALPAGLSLAANGMISGTPTQRGGYTFSVRSQDSLGDFVDKGYTGTVQNPALSIDPTSGTAIQGIAFSQTLVASGGVAPHDFMLESGTFPAGISISSAGVISGTTAAAPGAYPVVLRVTDSSTGPGAYFELENYTLTVSSAPSVSIAVSPAAVSEDGAATLVYTVTRSLNLSSPTVVNLTTGGTATSGVDYTGAVATVTIPAGATTATVTIDPSADGTVEADETVVLTVAAGSGYTVGTPSSATGTILNDDAPVASIAVSPASVAEDDAGNLTYTVSLDQPSTIALSVGYLVGGTATNGSDYAPIASPVIIPAGNTSATVIVDPVSDATIEADETVTLTLAAGAGYTIGTPDSATGTILNDDLPGLTIDDVAFPEGDSGTFSVPFTISLSSPAGPGGVSFDIATADGTATAGSDYIANSLAGQTIPAGSSTYVFNVDVNGDLLNEPTETFFVNVTNVVGAIVVDGQGVGTIANDDAQPSLSIDDVTVVEGNGGTTLATFTVSLSAASGQTVSVDYATADGTAVQPGDYTGTNGTLTFTPGQTTATIAVPVTGETVPEADETFFVDLSGANNATVADGQGVGTISNDDVPVTVGPGTVPNGTAGVAYSQALTASGGSGPYVFSVTAGALPAGVTLSPGGVLGGTPTAGGNFGFTVTATDTSPFPGPFSGSQAYTLVIDPATISLPATALAGGMLGAAYSEAITPASGGNGPYGYAVTAGALPGGLALDPATGAITGTAGALGTFNFSITATDSSTGTGPYTATQSYSIVVTDQPPVANPVSATVAYGAPAGNVALDITGGAPSSVAVATAPGHGTAVASGTTITYQPDPGYAGPDSFTYTASNGGGTSAPATVTITVGDPVISITAGGSLNATVGAAYSQTFTFNGGTTPWSGYQVANLPAGLSITGTTVNTVTVSGTPTQAGSFSLNVSATDSSTGNGPYSVGEVFALDVAAPVLSLSPTGTTFNVGYGAAYVQSFAASGGVGPYSYAVSGSLPPGVSLSGDTLSGVPTATGTFSFAITATDTGASGTGSPFTVSENYVLDVGVPTVTLSPATLPAADPGSPYAQSLGAGGGVAPYEFALVGGALPAGLTLSGSGALAGTPTEVGTFAITIQATDAHGQTGSQGYSLVVNAPTLAMAPSAGTLTLTYGAAYSQAFVVSGSPGPYSYAVSGALPAGVVFSDGTLSGTPTASGSYPVTITATDTTLTGTGAPFSIAQSYTLEVPAPAVTIDPATLPDTTAGQAYAQAITASGGVAPYTFAVTAGTLPDGLVLATDGAMSGAATSSGSFGFTVTATDANGQSGSRAYTIEVAVPTLDLTPTVLVEGTAGSGYEQVLTVGGGIAPYSTTLAGTLPAGIAFDAATLTLSGTPTQAGAFDISVTVTDSTTGTAATVTRDYTLTVAAPVLVLTPATLADASAGVAYSQSFVADGGIAPYSYAVSSGALPAGLVLDPTTGALAGTPTVAGSFEFAVTATDSTAGMPGTATNAYTLTVTAPTITIDPATLPTGVSGLPYTQALSAAGGSAPYEFAVTDGTLPGGLTLAGDGTLGGTPSAGSFEFTVTATDALGFTGARTYAVEIVDRPDPTRDPEVRGLLEAQADSARRFASAQMGNFQQRLENLHDNRQGAQLSNRLSFAMSQHCADRIGRKPGDPCDDLVASTAAVGAGHQEDGAQPTAADGSASSPFGAWVGGVIRSGNQDGRGGGAGVDFETDGISAGVDYRVSPAFAFGGGIGLGRDDSDVGDNGSRVEGDAYALVLYASYHPGDRFFLDGLLGYQRLSYDLRRYVTPTGGFVHGSRDGTQWFGSLSAGAQYQRDNWQLTPYARIDVSSANLDAYVERGDPVYSLAHGEMDVDSTTGNLGFRFESRRITSWGAFAPQARLEYQYDFDGDSSATMQYADLLTAPLYHATLVGFDRSRVMIGLGAMFYLPRDMSLRAEYRGLFGNGGDRDNGLMLNFEKGY